MFDEEGTGFVDLERFTERYEKVCSQRYPSADRLSDWSEEFSFFMKYSNIVNN